MCEKAHRVCAPEPYVHTKLGTYSSSHSCSQFFSGHHIVNKRIAARVMHCEREDR